MDVLLAMVGELNVIFLFLAALLVCAIIHGIWVKLRSVRTQLPKVPTMRPSAVLQLVKSDDPRVAVAAMLVVVASAEDRLTDDKQQRIVDMLTHTVGTDAQTARICLKQGLQRAQAIAKDGGDVAARLQKLKAPIQKSCSPQEKRDVIEMLQKIAGPAGQRTGMIGDGIRQLAASLTN
jgi:uncharacterized tellurite resistance protein B-like protein